jgi:acyl carrier protein
VSRNLRGIPRRRAETPRPPPRDQPCIFGICATTPDRRTRRRRRASTHSRYATGLANIAPESHAALGPDSLQRVELVAALEKSFGRHLPDTIYTQAATLGDLAAAVQKHLIDHPHSNVTANAIPAENFDVALFPEYLEWKRHKRMLLAVTDTNPYFRVDQGNDTLTQATRGLAHIDGRALTNFCAYDYVGMAHDPVVTAATKDAIDRYGTGAGASRLVSGEKQIHRDLEHALAVFIGTPAAIVFVSGHATNVTTIGHRMGPET